MKRTWIGGLASLVLVLALVTSAWSYTLELQYFSISNVADAYARNTPYSTFTPNEFMPGERVDSGEVSQSATTGGSPAIATGGGTTRQAVVVTDQVDSNRWIFQAYAAAGHTDDDYYDGYAQGYGSSIFGFQIVPGPGDPSQLYATIGYKVNGRVDLAKASPPINKLILEYGGALKYFTPTSDLQIAYEKKTWKGSIISTDYSNGGEVRLLLDANQFYLFEGFLQVDAQVYGWNVPGENRIDYEAFLSIGNLVAIPVPPAILLLGSGLLALGLSSRKSRG